VTYSDANNDGLIGALDIKQINSYYPFGLNMEGNFNGAAGTNKYQYNGKEWNDDFGLGLNDYGARFYDAAIGRFAAVDPLGAKFATMSPYHYAGDNPIKFIDPSGMASEAYTSIDQANRNVENGNTQAANFGKTDQAKFNSITSSDIAGSYSLKAFGTKSYVGGKKIGEKVDGYNLVKSSTGNIHIGGGSAFVKRAEDDIGVLNSTVAGSNLLSQIFRNSKAKVYVGEASGFALLGGPWKPTPTEDLAASITKPITQQAGNGTVATGDISVTYSQHWGVMYDGVLTRSYLTLAHELQHVLDIFGGLTNRDLGEERAVGLENKIRIEQKIQTSGGEQELRTMYHGKKL
jgi:RHS repeat-associated protein